MNAVDAGKVIAVLRKCYVDQTVDDDLDELWAVLLDDVTYQEAMAAAKEYMRHSTFFPKPSEVLDQVLADRKRRALGRVEILPQGARPPLGPDQYYAYDGTVITATEWSAEKWAELRAQTRRLIRRMPGSDVPTPITAKDGEPF